MDNLKLSEYIKTFKDHDLSFQTFVDRCEIAEYFINLDTDAMHSLDCLDNYAVYLKLLYQEHDKIYFEQEKEICDIFLSLPIDNMNPIRQQYLALVLLLFNKIEEAKKLLNKRFLNFKVERDIKRYIEYTEYIVTTVKMKKKIRLDTCLIMAEWLKDKYGYITEKYKDFKIDENTKFITNEKDFNVYFCWLQGKDNMPPLIQMVYNARQKYIGPYNFVFIDDKNYKEYVNLPDYIEDKYNKGYITKTHLSDILRVNLLYKHGGMWLDATIFPTKPLNKINDFIKLTYYTQKYRYTQADFDYNIDFGRWASFFQSTNIIGYPFFGIVKEFFDAFLKDYDIVFNYFLIDYAMNMAYDLVPFIKQEVDSLPINNTDIALLEKNLSRLVVREDLIDKLLNTNFLYKLSTKVRVDTETEGTVFKYLCKKFEK